MCLPVGSASRSLAGMTASQATPPPPPPPPTATAVRATMARAATGPRRKRGTSKLTVTRRPTLGMDTGQTGVQLSQ